MAPGAIMMDRERTDAFLKSLLVCLLVLSLGNFTMAHDVMASDNPLDFPSSYRYVMNGSELSRFGVGPIGLVPLSANFWNMSPEDFSHTKLGGNLLSVNASNATRLPAYTISYISCDEPTVLKAITDSFNSTDVSNVLAAVLYSQLHTHCNISRELARAGWLNLFTVLDADQARKLAALGLGGGSLGIVQITPDLSSLPPGTQLNPPRKGSPIPMIILYAITSIITVLLLIVIVGGAIKARRHPERYGPRAVIGRARQSRARGIAMAMLETLPIVKFGDPDPKQDKSVDQGGDVEMAPAAKGTPETDEKSKSESPSKEGEQFASKSAVDIASLSSPLPVTDDAATSTASSAAATSSATATAVANTESGSAAGAQANDPPRDAPDSLGCSICTEDFALGEELRVLPCNHKFHPFCVDPWLLNVSGTCPLCRIDLCPPREAAGENGGPVLLAGPRPRSTIGGIMRGTRVLDLQAIVEASREERIRILRRWRQERQRQRRQQQQQETEPGMDGATDVDVGADANTDTQPTNNRLLNSLLGEGFSPRLSSGVHPSRSRSRRRALSGFTERPRTWYAGEVGFGFGFGSESRAGAGPEPGPGAGDTTTQPPRSPLSSNRAPRSTSSLAGRARSWYGQAGAAANRRLG